MEAPFDLLRPRRRITGMSAVLLPHRGGEVDWAAFDAHLARTVDAGLVPAVNMDTGFVHLLDDETRAAVLDRTAAVLGGGSRFVAGAFVADDEGASLDVDAYGRAATAIAALGGIPIVFPSYGSRGREVELCRALASHVDPFLAFELGPMFVPFGRILDLDEYRELLAVDACIGAKHSSLAREPEWERLRLRDALRPDFLVLTGNDLAIDMVMYGSDYLLGISTFAPDVFAERDRAWEKGDTASFFALDDALQALGTFAFRAPVPAYRHDATLFLQLRGWLGGGYDALHPGAPRRPFEDAERDVLRSLGRALGVVA